MLQVRGNRDPRIAIEGDDPPAARDDLAAVTARAEGAVDVRAAGMDRECVDRFGEQNREVRINRARAPR